MPEDVWQAWRRNNMRLLADGWMLCTDFLLDGTIKDYAEKDGVRIARDPPPAITLDK